MLCGQCVFAPYVGWLMVGGVPVFVNQCVPLLAVDLWAHEGQQSSKPKLQAPLSVYSSSVCVFVISVPPQLHILCTH